MSVEELDPAAMPDTLDYDAVNRRLLIGSGYVEGVSARVWNYEVSGKQVLRQWFSHRKANRERPIIGRGFRGAIEELYGLNQGVTITRGQDRLGPAPALGTGYYASSSTASVYQPHVPVWIAM